MKARVIFYHDDAGTVVLAQKRNNGGMLYTLWNSVSVLVNYIQQNGIEVTFGDIETV